MRGPLFLWIRKNPYALDDTDLAVLIIEVVQEGLQQLVRIVDPLRILAYVRNNQSIPVYSLKKNTASATTQIGKFN